MSETDPKPALKFCRDCVYRTYLVMFNPKGDPICCAPAALGEPDLVTGEQNRPTCDFARRTDGMCGREARWYHEIHTAPKTTWPTES